MEVTSKTSGFNDEDYICFFEPGDKIIWDSHFGYETGYYIGKGNQYDTHLVILTSGMVQEPVSHSITEIHPYSEELILKLKNKYNYNSGVTSQVYI